MSLFSGLRGIFNTNTNTNANPKTPDELIEEAWKKEAAFLSRTKVGITIKDYQKSYNEVRKLYGDIYVKFKYPPALNRLAMLVADYANFTSKCINIVQEANKVKTKEHAIVLFNNATMFFDKAIQEMEIEPNKEEEPKKINYYKTKQNKALHILRGLILQETGEILVDPDYDGCVSLLKDICGSNHAMGCYYLGGVLYEHAMKQQNDAMRKQYLIDAIHNLEKSNSISDSTGKVNQDNRYNTNRLIGLSTNQLLKIGNSAIEQRYAGAGGRLQLKRTSRTTKSRKYRKRVNRPHKKSRSGRSSK